MGFATEDDFIHEHVSEALTRANLAAVNPLECLKTYGSGGSGLLSTLACQHLACLRTAIGRVWWT